MPLIHEQFKVHFKDYDMYAECTVILTAGDALARYNFMFAPKGMSFKREPYSWDGQIDATVSTKPEHSYQRSRGIISVPANQIRWHRDG